MRKVILASLLFFVLGCSKKSGDQTTQSFDGLEISFEVNGNGDPTLIFLHGWAGNKNHFKYMVDHFSTTYQTVSIDLAGFGKSGNNRNDWSISSLARDVVHVIDQLKINNAILVGHSLGGLVILEVAKQTPEKIIGLIPLDIVTDGNIKSKLTSDQIEGGVEYWMDWATNPTYEKTRTIFSNETDSLIIAEVVSALEEASKVGWKESIYEAFIYLNELDQSIAEINVPIHCINTSQNKLDIDIARTFSPYISESIISNVGHFFLWDAPEESNRLIQQGIEKIISN